MIVLLYVGPMPEDGLVISGPSIDDVITFAGGSVTPLIDIPFPIQDDSVPNEPLEVFNLTLSEPSDSRVLIGGSVDSIITVFAQTEINIADDDVETSEFHSTLVSCVNVANNKNIIIMHGCAPIICMQPHRLPLSQ